MADKLYYQNRAEIALILQECGLICGVIGTIDAIILNPHAKAIQRVFRAVKKRIEETDELLYQCDDCHRWFWWNSPDESALYTYACPQGCCCKLVCPEACVFTCDKCKKRTMVKNNIPEYRDGITCNHCHKIFVPPYVWYGMSMKQYEKRMEEW